MMEFNELLRTILPVTININPINLAKFLNKFVIALIIKSGLLAMIKIPSTIIKIDNTILIFTTGKFFIH